MIRLKLNGKEHALDIDLDMPLVWAIREHLKLTGTKYSCGVGTCGACTVHLNGNAIRSCTIAISTLKSTDEITTIEGLSQEGKHCVQQAWINHQVAQCGYCQSGQIMSAAALISKNPNPSDADIDNAMSGNICRCGTYHRIRAAIHDAAASLNITPSK